MRSLLESGFFAVVLTLAAFRVGQLCQRKWKLALFNPTLIGAALVMAVLLLTRLDAGDYTQSMTRLSWLMTPATVALAIPMYQQFQALRKNGKAVAAGVAAGVLCCAAVLLLGCAALGLSRELTVSLLPKSVTTAIGVSLSELYGGLGGVTTAAIIVTGIFANMTGPALCRLFGITQSVAQGVAFGTAGHVIATARANELDALTGAVSSLSLVVAGLLTALLFPALAALV